MTSQTYWSAARPILANRCARGRAHSAILLALMVVMSLPFLASAQAKKKKAADNPFAEFVRKSDPLTPPLEQKSFHLPPGFEIQLVASEPDISKPMNMAFDEQGRLWITQSREYPFPAATNKPARDAIKILSDFDKTGRAKRITTFAEGLNIPIGLYPYRGGAIGFSIPGGVYTFEDQNRDGKSDKQTVLYAGQGYDRDTHGLTSAFRRGYDGWIYACHGYNNNSTIRGTDGHTITMNSGNLYRMRPDGTRVEQWTHGQVNPFGLMFDPYGDLFSADCHSSPIYMVLRGAYYPSFGKPHDGLGFGPDICTHSHGSTAICGIVLYYAEQFPEEYRGNSFIGNVMTCRIDRDSYVQHGSTRIAKEEPDFLISDDPWFRPVDLQLGPDGAIYVADFYNRIIGHYEVPLDHPGRDRERGRIWRIVYHGDKKQKQSLPQDFNIAKANANELIKQLASANISQRMRATDQLSDRLGKDAVKPLEKMLDDPKSTPEQKVHGMWALYRLGELTTKEHAAAAKDSNSIVRLHAMRVLSETPNWQIEHHELAFAGLRDSDPYVRRAAADAVGCHPQPEYIRPLLDLRHAVPPEDSQLLHTVRMALRNQLQATNGYAYLANLKLSEPDRRALADVSVGVQGPEAGAYLMRYINDVAEPRDKMITYLRHAGRFASDADLANLGNAVRARFPNDPDAQYAAYKSVQEGFAQRGAGLSQGLRIWATQLAGQLMSAVPPTINIWQSRPVPGLENSENPWSLEKRKCSDLRNNEMFLSSRAIDETYTGICQSPAFVVPAKFSFFIAGHDGEPDHPPVKKNYVRLIEVNTHEVLAKAVPPRNDQAQPITWDLLQFAGKMAFLEIVDGHDDDGYAWLAVGRFDPPVISLPEYIPNSTSQRERSAAELVRTVPLPMYEHHMKRMFDSAISSPSARAAAAHALITINHAMYMPQVAATLANSNNAPTLRENIATFLADMNAPDAREAVLGALPGAPRRVQIKLVQAMVKNPEGAERLLTLVEQKRISATVLQDRTIKERLTAAKLNDFKARFEKATKDLPAANKDLQRLIDRRRNGYEPEHASATRGGEVFTKTCAVCHQIDGRGAVIGPQLDGAGNRGLERLVEDILDPNRNVDPAFRYSIVTLKNDTTITGLQRREEGETLVFADATGKEITVAKKDIAERKESELSLMPANFGEALTDEQFYDLMAFLLAHGSK